MASHKRGKLIFLVGSCSICGDEEVDGRHYRGTHGISIRDHFRNYGTGERGKTYPKTCIACGVRVDDPHEAVAHLVKYHLDTISGMNGLEPEPVVSASAEDEDEKLLLRRIVAAMAAFIIVMEREKRLEAEARTRLQSQFDELLRRVNALEKKESAFASDLAKFQKSNLLLQEENARLISELFQFKAGIRIESDFRALYEEYRRG